MSQIAFSTKHKPRSNAREGIVADCGTFVGLILLGNRLKGFDSRPGQIKARHRY